MKSSGNKISFLFFYFYFGMWRRLELPFLASSVPNLSLDNLGIDIQSASGELNANGGLRLEVELVLGEPRQQIRLPNSGVSDQHNLKQVVVVIVTSVTRHSKLLLLLLQLAANILLFLLFIYGYFVWFPQLYKNGTTEPSSHQLQQQLPNSKYIFIYWSFNLLFLFLFRWWNGGVYSTVYVLWEAWKCK